MGSRLGVQETPRLVHYENCYLCHHQEEEEPGGEHWLTVRTYITNGYLWIRKPFDTHTDTDRYWYTAGGKPVFCIFAGAIRLLKIPESLPPSASLFVHLTGKTDYIQNLGFKKCKTCSFNFSISRVQESTLESGQSE